VTTAKFADAIDLTPEADETFVIRKQDDIGISELTTVQIDFADPSTPGARWELAKFSMTVTAGQGS
jgi:hypothetical protein